MNTESPSPKGEILNWRGVKYNFCCHCSLGPYLVVITKKTLVGHIKGHEVWKIKGTDVLAFPRATLHLTESQVCGSTNGCATWNVRY